MTVVKSPVIQLATAEHEVELKELRNERAAARTDVTRKCKLKASFFLFNQHGSSSFLTPLKHCVFVIA